MSEPEIEELQERIDNSPALTALRNQLQKEIGFRAEPSVEFSPLLIISLISLTIQIIKYCQERNNPEELRANMRDLRSLPPRQLLRLRRRVNALWQSQPGVTDKTPNPLMDALFELSDSADDSALDELLWLAERDKGDHA
jgi:hypothetical protein